MHQINKYVRISSTVLRAASSIVRGFGTIALITVVDDEAYIDFSIFTSVLTIVVLFMGLELYQKTNMALNEDGQNLQTIITRHMNTIFYMVVLCISVIFAASFIDNEIWINYSFIVLVSCFDIFSQEISRLLNSVGNPLKSAIVYFFRLNAWIFLIIYLVLKESTITFDKLMLVYLSGSAISSLIALYCIKNFLQFKIENLKPLINFEFFKYILPIILALILLRFNFTIERSVISIISSESQAVSYLLTLSILGLLPVAMEALYIQSQIREIHSTYSVDSINYETLIAVCFNIIFVSMIVGAIITATGSLTLSFIRPDIVMPDFKIIMILISGYTLFILTSFVSYIVYVRDKNYLNLQIDIISSLIGGLAIYIGYTLQAIELVASWLLIFSTVGIWIRIRYIKYNVV